MQYNLISGDNHIDLTYLPPDLWSSQAPGKWKLMVPRVEELEDGCHWFVDAQDKGMWNGVGPGFLPYTRGMFGHIDEMRDIGFEWDSRPGARPRPTTPELRLADLDRDGIDAEIVYGCLMINDLMQDAGLRSWADKMYNDWAADFAKRADPRRVFPLAIIPNTDPIEAAAEVRRCAKMGLRGGDLAFKRMSPPLYHDGWFPLWEAAAECKFPIAFPSQIDAMTRIGAVTFGRMWLRMIRGWRQPKACAASTYRFCLAASTAPRTIREFPGMITIAIASIALVVLGLSTETIASASTSPGMAWIASMTRWANRSRRPSQ